MEINNLQDTFIAFRIKKRGVFIVPLKLNSKVK